MLVGTGTVLRTVQCPWRLERDWMKEEQMSDSRCEKLRLTQGCRGIESKKELLEGPCEASWRSISFVLFWSVLS